MEIHAVSTIRHPRERVLRAYRDELPKIAAYMPNVKQVVVQKREEGDGWVKLHNVWTGKAEIPRMAQSIVKPEILLWDDYATWHEAESYCEWRIGLRVFNETFKCAGTNHIRAEGAHTRVELRGDLQLDLTDIPGVPRLLAGTMRSQLEAFIVKMIRPNLEETNVALGRYLDANP